MASTSGVVGEKTQAFCIQSRLSRAILTPYPFLPLLQLQVTNKQ